MHPYNETACLLTSGSPPDEVVYYTTDWTICQGPSGYAVGADMFGHEMVYSQWVVGVAYT